MIKVITYGTYDLLHYGHINLLKRAKSLGDYLIVGVTAEDFDKNRGKINVQQSLMERVENVRRTGLADEIIIEEYEGQKIDDIKRYNIDIFTVGSDWKGKFDYLNEYCKVVYLDRTEGISSTEIRSEQKALRLGIAGSYGEVLKKYYHESQFVNGIHCAGVYMPDLPEKQNEKNVRFFTRYEELIDACDAVYIVSAPKDHYKDIQYALNKGKHVLCESPVCMNVEQYQELKKLAEEKHAVLVEAIKTAYATAYDRLLLLIKSGRIGKVISVDATCTSIRDVNDPVYQKAGWNCFQTWAPTAMLPVFQLLGTNYLKKNIVTWQSENPEFDIFSKVDFIYEDATASIKVGAGVKSEGELVISGTKGYVYVPAPWWKTDYFEIRYEDQTVNKRYFYQLDGEGIRYAIVSFQRTVENGKNAANISDAVTKEIVRVTEDFKNQKDTIVIHPESGSNR